MWYNYLKIAFRNLNKFKAYASINILGLAIGMACCLIIVQFIRYELNFDGHHKNGEQIYRVSTEFLMKDRQVKGGTTPSPLALAIQKDFPEVLEAGRIYKAPVVDKFLLRNGDRSFFEQKTFFADSTIFRLLTYDFIAGDPQHALDEPFNVVLSDEIAHKLFEQENPIGQNIEIESLWGKDVYKVTGVFNKGTYQSHLDADVFISGMSGAVGRRFYRLDQWGGNNLFFTFIKLDQNADPKALEAKLPEWLDAYAGAQLKEMGFQKVHFLQPISDIYLGEVKGGMVGPHGDMRYIYILGSIAVFILFIACINFMNLTTAKATVRAREVGVRKVIGATRPMLIKQFISEAFIYTCIAVIIAFGIAELFLPLFNNLIGKELTINIFDDWVILPWLALFLSLTTLLAGGYPAAYLSSFNPASIIKKNFGDRFSAGAVRKGLVVLQFVISIALIQGVLVINEQMNYIRNKNLGFNAEEKIIISLNSQTADDNFSVLKNEVLSDARVKAAGGTSIYPGVINIENMLMYGETQTAQEGTHTSMAMVEPDFLDLMEFELLEGRLFSNDRLADTLQSVVINEKLAKGLGYTLSSAIGKEMKFDWRGQTNSFKIIGIVKDFHEKPLHQPIDGYAFFMNLYQSRKYLVANVQTEEIEELLASLQAKWEAVNPGENFEYYFLDDEIQRNYQADQRMSGLIRSGTLIAIFISCLGLLGLATFTAERKAKEIGVRKVLGATSEHIVYLLSKDFLKLILIALIIATPIAWYVMGEWLQNFHYRTDMPIWAYLIAGGLAIFVAFATILWQSLKAAKANPIKALRMD